MLYEDRYFKISRDRLLSLLSEEYERERQEQLHINDLLKMDGKPIYPIEPFNREKALSEFEELPSNNKKIISIKILESE